MRKRVLIIGAGAAGLSAAVRLAANGYSVTICERSASLGGRLSYEAEGDRASVLWGWYVATESMLRRSGMPAELTQEHSAPLTFLFPDGRHVRVPRPMLPGPLRLFSGLGRFTGLPLSDRWRLLNRLEQRWEQETLVPPDLDGRSAMDWLVEMGQSEKASRQVWTPLSRFLIGQEPGSASAATFLAALRRCWLTARRASALRIPRRDLHSLLVEPARETLGRLGVRIQHDAIEQLRCDAHRVTAAHTAGGLSISVDWYIAAVPSRSLTPLLPERAVTRFSYFQQLAQLRDTPALTVSLTPHRLDLKPEVKLLSARPFHWIVTRPELDKEPARISLIAVGVHELLEEDDDTLRRLAIDELSRAVRVPIEVRSWAINRQHEAFLSLRPGTAALRPLTQSPFSNFLLAGDWTDTGLPPNVESAILSGERCADAIMAKG
jgi:uncharacterized protein with NAD-binding domain and iron-sulfur cluster